MNAGEDAHGLHHAMDVAADEPCRRCAARHHDAQRGEQTIGDGQDPVGDGESSVAHPAFIAEHDVLSFKSAKLARGTSTLRPWKELVLRPPRAELRVDPFPKSLRSTWRWISRRCNRRQSSGAACRAA